MTPQQQKEFGVAARILACESIQTRVVYTIEELLLEAKNLADEIAELRKMTDPTVTNDG